MLILMERHITYASTRICWKVSVLYWKKMLFQCAAYMLFIVLWVLVQMSNCGLMNVHCPLICMVGQTHQNQIATNQQFPMVTKQ